MSLPCILCNLSSENIPLHGHHSSIHPQFLLSTFPLYLLTSTENSELSIKQPFQAGAVYFLTMYLERRGAHYLHSQFLLPISLLLLHRNLCFFEMTVTELIYPRPLLIAVICTPLWLTDFLFSPIMLKFWVVLASIWYTTPASEFLDLLYFSDFHLHPNQTNNPLATHPPCHG